MDAARREIVVLTGAAGFLGYHTLKLLIERDENVSEIRCLDLREPERSMRQSIDDLITKHNEANAQKTIKWVQGDIRDINLVEQIVVGADCIIHLAAKIDMWVEKSEQNVEELESVNVDGTENLLKAAVRAGVYKFIHISSFEIYTSLETIYFATENTLPVSRLFLFGPSGSTKKEAELKVKQYSNNKLSSMNRATSADPSNPRDSLNAIIVRFPEIYGEYDKYYISRIMKVTKKFFKGRLQRLSNVWINRQPIYVGNAAWSLIQAKHKMDHDHGISEFHITDETAISDPFNFITPYLKCKGLEVTQNSYPFIPIYFLLVLFLMMKRLLSSLDAFGLFTEKKDRVKKAIEQDELMQKGSEASEGTYTSCGNTYEDWNPQKWYEVITPQTVGFMAMSAFLNRTKATLRLDYEPIYDPQEAQRRSIEWYEKLEL